MELGSILLDPEVTEFYNGIMITGPRSWVDKQMEKY